VEAAEDFLEARVEVDGVKGEHLTLLHPSRQDRSRPDLDIPQSPLSAFEFQGSEQALQLLRAVHQRLAMVREWEGYQSPPSNPARHAAQNHSIGQASAWPSGRIDDGIESIGPPQRLEPTRRVEHGGVWMSLDQLRPAWIPTRVDLVGCRHSF